MEIGSFFFFAFAECNNYIKTAPSAYRLVPFFCLPLCDRNMKTRCLKSPHCKSSVVSEFLRLVSVFPHHRGNILWLHQSATKPACLIIQLNVSLLNWDSSSSGGSIRLFAVRLGWMFKSRRMFLMSENAHTAFSAFLWFLLLLLLFHPLFVLMAFFNLFFFVLLSVLFSSRSVRHFALHICTKASV